MTSNPPFLEQMIASKSSTSVIRLSLLKVKKKQGLVFIFEGKDDYSYYEHAIKECGFRKKYEHINGEGKEQLLNFLRELLEGDDDEEEKKLLDNTIFFVDQDYDLVCYYGKHIYNLPCYAIENMLLDEMAIESILKSEFSLDGSHEDIRTSLIDSFRLSYSRFSEGMRNISYALFLSKIVNAGDSYPKFSDLIDKVEYNDTKFKIDTNKYLQDTISQVGQTPFKEFLDVIKTIEDQRIIRGKYILTFIQNWCEAAKKNTNTTYSNRLPSTIKFGRETINIRRLSQSCSINNHLMTFLKTI
ncbi:DUF4435 domain-containing protein [Aeromonas veronii]|uniref:DUF4435 domain-containing protein n=1 Tax=Aeromonas veronii TaxID=654 RepID=UPI0031FC5667